MQKTLVRIFRTASVIVLFACISGANFADFWGGYLAPDSPRTPGHVGNAEYTLFSAALLGSWPNGWTPRGHFLMSSQSGGQFVIKGSVSGWTNLWHVYNGCDNCRVDWKARFIAVDQQLVFHTTDTVGTGPYYTP